ncbi:hypothetical protein [Roseomonas sp. KE0001]|uniref:hypothetical protein n=1 Tax=unclassified Roseomonas TaxID=2617492 RepID=UPI0018E00C3D|nr:hypothetical protein [Roseomonas sp. KE0001]
MDMLRSLADHSIRRVLCAAALAILAVMFGLGEDPVLALQSGALMTAAVWLGLWGAALQIPRIDLRRTGLWRQLSALAGEGGRRLRGPDGHRQLAAVLAERLMWHADRAGLAALGLAGATFALQGYRVLRG